MRLSRGGGPAPAAAPGRLPGSRPSSNSGNLSGGERVFAHISDLQQQALAGYNPQGNIHQLLQAGETALQQADTLLNFRRPDLSYVEYIRASQIVVEDVPHHRTWPDFQLDRDGGFHRWTVMQKKINGKAEMYSEIKKDILDNNRRHGTQPRGQSNGGPTVNAKTETVITNGNHINGHGAIESHKLKPAPSPKPEKLHGRAVSMVASTATTDALNERFARLRMANGGGALDTSSRGAARSEASSMHSSPISMPNANDFMNRSSTGSPSKVQALRPQGPRGMPTGAVGPAVPGKLPLDTSVAPSMPKAPSPTYSPARNMQITGDIAPPRHSARSLATTRRSSTMNSSASYHAPNGTDQSGDYFPAANEPSSPNPHRAAAPHATRRKSVHISKESRISTKKLYDYLTYYSLLLIDFRPREEFDQGHVYTRNIINIDPVSLSPGMSADELLERMILSPDTEQEMFINRDQYDLVVYYDADTRSDTYLHNPMNEKEMKLKCLHEALYEFNQDKPLQRPPILLIGGIDAWADLIGSQALASSTTAARAKQGRGLQRRPPVAPGNNSQLRVSKRRLRDYNPLDADEEKSWHERARAESVILPVPPSTEDAKDVDDDEEAKRLINDFNARFPDAGTLDQNSRFVNPSPARAPPNVPAKVPIYPPTPPPSNYPTVPARPKPAAPRPSYTGVSERSSSQNAPTSRSGQLAPYVPPKYLAPNLRLPKTGLQNFGQTCYMNATLQALSATTPLSVFFLDDRFKHDVQPDNWKGTKGVMPQLYSNLVRSLWKGDVGYIRPSTFRNFCGRLKREWGTNEQQDAKEFFDFVVDCLHEDLNSMWARTPLRAMTPEEEAHRERMPKSIVSKTEWHRYTHRELSFLTELFGGQHLSRLKCSHCGWTSTTYEAFYSISVEIPSQRSSSSQFPTLDDCFRSYCQEEVLTGDDRFKCEGKCNAIRDGTKQLLITRVPQFLVVHFKRFSTNAYGRAASKIRTPVNFPLQGFNLEPYVLPPPSPEEAQRIAQQGHNSQRDAEPCMTPPFSYDAYAVVRHIGATLQSGHYTAAVKDRARGVWRYFNDERASDFEPGQQGFRDGQDLRNEQAYIVFYQRNTSGGMAPMPPGKI